MNIPWRSLPYIHDPRTNGLAFALHVFQTESHSHDQNATPHPMREYQQAVNPKTGRLETVFADLRLVYPDYENPMAIEYSFEELRARHRGWLDRDWAAVKKTRVSNANKQDERQATAPSSPGVKPSPLVESHEKAHMPKTVPLKGLEDENDENDENAPPSQADMEKAKAARKARREERANRTRKIKVMEVREIRAETQTSTPSSDHVHASIANLLQFKPISIRQQDLRLNERRMAPSPL